MVGDAGEIRTRTGAFLSKPGSLYNAPWVSAISKTSLRLIDTESLSQNRTLTASNEI